MRRPPTSARTKQSRRAACRCRSRAPRCAGRRPTPDARLLSSDVAEAALDQACLLRDGSLLAVVAQSQYLANRAAAAAAAALVWDTVPAAPLPDESALAAWIRRQPADASLVGASPQAEGAGAKPAAHVLSASYSRPYIAHASLAPSCALARFSGGKLTVWTH